MQVFYLAILVAVFSLNITTCEEYAKCTVELDLDACNSSPNAITTECHEAPVCRKHFNILYMNNKPYHSHILNDTLKMCCGDCVSSSIVMNISRLSDIKPEIMNTSHFVFPVLGKKDTHRLYGYRFLPMFETPNIYYVTRKDDSFTYNLIVSCLNMWPLFLVSALMVIISGFLFWVAEMWWDKDHLQTSFVSGWFEGIWWSFISMTTVGYGDRVPTSVCGRLLTFIWIIIGITSFSLITATLTSEIIAANSLSPPAIKHARVGLIRPHKYEGILVANQGGLLVSTAPAKLPDGIHDLIEMLNKKTIDGFVLDHYELMLFPEYYQNNTAYKHDVQFIKQETVLTQIKKNEDFAYGILIKLEEDYQFLDDFLSSNSDVFDTCSRLFLSRASHKLAAHKKVTPFSSEGKMFWKTLVACVVLVIICVSFGVAYELRRRTPHVKEYIGAIDRPSESRKSLGKKRLQILSGL